MDDCVFCNIINRTIASEPVWEDDELVVIKDIVPKAPVHLLIIPKKHILSATHITEADQPLLGKMIMVSSKMAKQFKIDESGYKLVFNVGRDGGMVVPHLHLHLLGGKNLGE